MDENGDSAWVFECRDVSLALLLLTLYPVLVGLLADLSVWGGGNQASRPANAVDEK